MQNTAWRIEDFFMAAAVRKGAIQLPDYLKAKAVKREVTRLRDYRIDWYLDGKPAARPWGSPDVQTANSFTIFWNGSWSYHFGPIGLYGKLNAPHSKVWLTKLLDKGTPGEQARLDWEFYFNLRNDRE